MAADSLPDALTSADQDAWVALAESVRARLAEMVPLLPAMKPDEVKTFIEAVDLAHCLHTRAVLWDKTVELNMARVTWD